ncbi:hypothetical protein [Salinispora arenicola]|uniref:hypothetical protein n=1 Tax=Salinispora arenicola TaxID=168697 RepID=UPI0039B1127F
MPVPSFDLATLPGVLVRPLIVAIAHLPIMVVALFAVPVWVMAVVRPASHGELALRLLKELRTWSRDVIGGTTGARAR